MSEIAKLKLSLNAAGNGTVTLDGVDISHIVTAIEVKVKSAELTEIKLTIFAEIDAELDAKLSRIALAKQQEQPEPEGLRLLDGRVLKQRQR